ncbi:MAG: hypothetical protein IJW46_01690 [Clostridia bacterium]|nr:hypothetical protein [Clostridia bacterium]
MFEKNDYVMYAGEGVCLIEDIREIAFDTVANGENKLYYVLLPLNKKDSYVYVPTDSQVLTARMRAITAKEEIEKTIDAVKGKTLPWITDRKRRTALYRTVKSEMRCDRLLLLLCSLYHQRHLLEKEGKRMAFSDNEMLSQCEALIRSEFAFSLKIAPEEVGAYIRRRLELES